MLTDIQIRNWIKAGPVGAKTDGDGLALTLSKAGTSAWILRYSIAGKRKELTLGRYPDISLTKAREIAAAKRAEVQQGIDVAAEKRKAEHAAANAWTFRTLAEDYFEKVADRLADAINDTPAKIPRESKPAAPPRRAAKSAKASPVSLHSVT
jgi:hypothetical protein